MAFPFDILAVFLPLLGAAVAGFFGRKIGDKASNAITCGCVLLAGCISIYLFDVTALKGHATNRDLFVWI